MPETADERTDAPIEIEVKSSVSRDHAALRVKVRTISDAERVLAQIMPLLRSEAFTATVDDVEVRVQPDTPTRRDAADRMRGLRERMNWSQTHLGELTGLGQSHISEIETGKRAPKPDTLSKIARVFRRHRPSRQEAVAAHAISA